MNAVFFSLDITKLRISSDPPHFYTGCQYIEQPLFLTFEQAKEKAREVAKAAFHAPDRTLQMLQNVTLQHLVQSSTASHDVYWTYTDDSGTKIDSILTLRALAADTSEAKAFYTYHLNALNIPVMPTKQRCYDSVVKLHGPMYATFEDAKQALLVFCKDTHSYPSLHEQVNGMSRDLMNIGKWKKSFKEDYASLSVGLQELRLDIFRLSLEV